MKNLRTESYSGDISSQWSSQVIDSLKLPTSHIAILDKLLERIQGQCKTVILNGSWANGSASSNSDIDILIIVEDIDRKEIIVSIIKGLFPNFRELKLDFKILSVENIRQLSSSSQHFAIWSLLTTGVVLVGIVPKSLVKLKDEKIRLLLSELISAIDECLTWVNSNISFSGASIQIAYIVRTIYFIEKYLLQNGQHPEQKADFIERILGRSHKYVERIYNESIRSQRNIGEMGVNLRMDSHKDRIYPKTQYQELGTVCLKLEKRVQQIHRTLISTNLLV